MTTSLLLLLEQQLQQLVQLNELLLLERDALTSRHPQHVVDIAKQKSTALDTLQQTDRQISESFQKTDFDADDIRSLKAKIDTELTHLKQLNDVNGKILKHKQLSNEQLQELIIGTRKDKTATTYNQLGKKSNSLKSRPIKA